MGHGQGESCLSSPASAGLAQVGVVRCDDDVGPADTAQKYCRDAYLLLAVPVSADDLVRLADRVEDKTKRAAFHAAETALQLQPPPPLKQFRASVLPTVTPLLRRHFELLGNDLASPIHRVGPVNWRDEGPEGADRAFLRFGFEAFATLGYFGSGATPPPSSQTAEELTALIRDEATDLVNRFYDNVLARAAADGPRAGAQHLLQSIFGAMTDAIFAAASNYIEQQTTAGAHGTWDTFVNHGVPDFRRREQENAERDARAKAAEEAEAKREAAFQEILRKALNVTTIEELMAMTESLTDDDTDRLLAEYRRTVKKQASRSGDAGQGSGDGDAAREPDQDTTPSSQQGDKSGKQGASQGDATARDGDIHMTGTRGGPDDNITAEEMNEGAQSDEEEEFYESSEEPGQPSPGEKSFAGRGKGPDFRKQRKQGSPHQSSDAGASGKPSTPSTSESFKQALRPTQHEDVDRGMFSPTQKPETPSKPQDAASLASTSESSRAGLRPTPRPNIPSILSPSYPYARNFILFGPSTPTSGSDADIEEDGGEPTVRRPTNAAQGLPATGASSHQAADNQGRSPLAPGPSSSRPFRSPGRPSSATTPYPTRPSVTEYGSPVTALRDRPRPTGPVAGSRLQHGSASDVSGQPPPPLRLQGREPPPRAHDQDTPSTPTRSLASTTLTHRPSPARRPHSGAHEPRESPYRRDRSIRRGSEGPSQHGDLSSASQTSQ